MNVVKHLCGNKNLDIFHKNRNYPDIFLKIINQKNSHKNRDRSCLHCLISFFNDSHHALTGVEQAAVTSFSVSLRTTHTLVTLRPDSAQAPSAYTHKASRTTTVIDIRDASLNQSAPAQSEEITRKLGPHVNLAQRAVLAWSRPSAVAHLLLHRVKGRLRPPLKWTEHSLSQLIWTKLWFVNLV